MSTNASAWPAPAKINLFLHVTGRRADGYHLLQTLFQFVDHGDTLHFTVREDGDLRRLSALAGIAPEQDLVVRAARKLRELTGCARSPTRWLEPRAAPQRRR